MASAVLALSMVVPGALPVYAEEPDVLAEPSWKTGVKDHWSFETGAIKFGDGVHGKIPEAGNNIYATYSVRRDGFTEISKAIKDTTAKINEKEKKEDLCDGMTIHPYSNTVKASDTDSFYDQAMLQAETHGIGKVERLMTDIPEEKVPVISEYGIFRNTESQLRSQTHAIYIAKVLMEYVRLGDPYIQKHCLTDWYSNGTDALGPTQQAVIQVYGGEEDRNTGESDKFKFFSTPSAYVFKMLNAGFGDNIVETEFSEVPTMSNGVETFSTLASMDESGNLYVAIVNADRENNRKIALKINGVDVTGRKMNVQRLDSETIEDELAAAKAESVMKDADYSKVDAAIAKADKLNKEDYKDFSKVEEAIAALEKVDEPGKPEMKLHRFFGSRCLQ